MNLINRQRTFLKNKLANSTINTRYLKMKTILKLFLSFLSIGLFASAATANLDELQPPGYLIVSGWYKNTGIQRQYTQKVSPLIREYGMMSAAIGMPGINLKVLEGHWSPRLFVMSRFPEAKNIKDFWRSAEYQDIKKLRESTSFLDVLIAKGMPEDPEVAMTAESAYLVFMVQLTDFQKFRSEYAPYAPSIVERYNGKFIIRSTPGDLELLEGEFPNESLVVLHFPNIESLRGFWNDKDYKRLSEVRKSTGSWSVVEIAPFPK